MQKALSLKLTPAHVFRPTERYEVQIKLTASRPGVMHPTVLFTFRSPQGVEFKISQLVVVSVKDANSDPALEPTSPLGLFVRHCVAAYYALTFDSLCRLYTEVRRYVDPLGELEAPGASHPRPPLLPRGHEP